MHTRKHTGGPRRRNSKTVLILAVILILALAIGGTVAFLIDQTDDVENTFVPAEFGSQIVEKFNGEEKSSIQVKNTGDVPIRVRVALVQNWITDEGQYCANHSNVTVAYNTADWELRADGFYYYKSTLQNKNDVTTNLLADPITLSEGEHNCKMQVEVLASVIQANADGAW